MEGYGRQLSRHAIDVHDRQKTIVDGAWDEVVRAIAARVGDGTVLDDGAGSGVLAARLWALGVDVVALDLNRSMLDVLAERTRGEVPIVMGDVTMLPMRNGAFDAALISNVLHMLPDWAVAVEEAMRVVRAGGHVLVNLGSGARSSDARVAAVGAHFRSLVAMEEGAALPGPSDEEELCSCLRELGARVEAPLTATGTATVSIASVIERMQHNIFMWPADVTDSDLADAASRTREWAIEEIGDLDAPLEVASSISITVARR